MNLFVLTPVIDHINPITNEKMEMFGHIVLVNGVNTIVDKSYPQLFEESNLDALEKTFNLYAVFMHTLEEVSFELKYTSKSKVIKNEKPKVNYLTNHTVTRYDGNGDPYEEFVPNAYYLK